MSDIERANKTVLIINLAVLISTIGYGITFPLLAIRLDELGVSGMWIGLNAAMPALGWFLGSAILPKLQQRFGVRAVMLGFMTLAIAGYALLSVADSYWSATALRFMFGGALGMFYRTIEFWLNAVSSDKERGRNLSSYNVAFMLGITIGTLVQPELGTSGYLVTSLVLASLLLGGTLVLLWPRLVFPQVAASVPAVSWSWIWAVPVAYFAVLAYGLAEDIPAYLMPIYALRNGLSEAMSAYVVTATMLGVMLFPIPIGMLSDRIGRTPPMVFCALAVIAISAVIPFWIKSPEFVLAAMFLWGGMAGSIGCLALAMLGDRFKGESLIAANATYGMVYAFGGLTGPLINGAAIDTLNTHGLMVSAGGIFSGLVMLIAIAKRFESTGRFE